MVKRSIAPLTSLRFFAAGAIVLHHLQGISGIPRASFPLGLAVSFFYLLSGFILCYVYSDLDDGPKARRFYLARFARIWPLHVATLLFAALVLVPGYTDRSLGAFIANALLVQSWWPSLSSVLSYNHVAWSISDEAFFYLLFPLVMVTKRWFSKIFAGYFVFTILLLVAGGKVAVNAVHETTIPTWYTFVQMGPPIRFFEFLCGVGLGFVYVRHKHIRLPVWAWTAFEVLALGAVFVYVKTMTQVMSHLTPVLGPITSHWYVRSGGFASFALVVLCFAYRGGVLSRVLAWSPLVLLGEISFSTYMIHQLMIRFWYQSGWLNVPSSLALTGLLAAIYGGSYVSWRYLEIPFQRLILRRFKPAIAANPSAVTAHPPSALSFRPPQHSKRSSQRPK